MAAKFQLGRLTITPAAQHLLSEEDVLTAFRRHVQGDWGDVDEHDAEQNEWALLNDARIMSVYKTVTGASFWVITEADRSSTTILLPEDY